MASVAPIKREETVAFSVLEGFPGFKQESQPAASLDYPGSPWKMDSLKGSEATQDTSSLARTIAKILHVHSGSGTVAGDGKNKMKLREEMKKDPSKLSSISCFEDETEKQRAKLAKEAFFAGVFSSVSTIKASYAQLQMAQYPYDPELIHSADGSIVAELKHLSELKHSFQKKVLQETALETTMLSYEIQELKSVILTYQITSSKLDSQIKAKDSELRFLREKLAEVLKESRLLEKGMRSTGELGVRSNISLSNLKTSHFTACYQRGVKCIQGFVRILISGIESSGWDIAAAANAIEPGITVLKPADCCHVFESFVCREMFDGFNFPDFVSTDKLRHDQEDRRSLSLNEFLELKSMKASDYLSQKPKSRFATYCQKKYLRLVHPKMESSLFGNLEQWHLVNSGDYPQTSFFTEFVEMAKHIWLLHCLALSFHPEVTVFQLGRGSHFSEVWMESLNGEAFFSNKTTDARDPRVAFTVVPGFRVCGTVLHCQVYLN